MATRKKNILVAPLDWGLGHATRCIPIIRLLLEKGCQVSIAGNGASLQLLRKEFPWLQTFELAGYNPVYPVKGRMTLTMAKQLPRFIHTINLEHREIESMVDQHQFDVVISDNRYGCWSVHAQSIFITHQSNILMPKRFGWMAPLVRKATKFAIRKFDMCWIPDLPGEESLAGDLISFGDTDFHRHVEFIGPLTRFRRVETSVPKYDIVAVCSGPEPQRTIFEALLRKQLPAQMNFLLVRGVIDDATEHSIENRVVRNYMKSEELNEAIAGARIVIARSGFSTVMDLAMLGKKAIFVPTPGQTEQEYLADRLQRKGIAFCMKQHDFDLVQALTESEKYSGFTMAGITFKHLEKQLEHLMNV